MSTQSLARKAGEIDICHKQFLYIQYNQINTYLCKRHFMIIVCISKVIKEPREANLQYFYFTRTLNLEVLILTYCDMTGFLGIYDPKT